MPLVLNTSTILPHPTDPHSITSYCTNEQVRVLTSADPRLDGIRGRLPAFSEVQSLMGIIPDRVRRTCSNTALYAIAAGKLSLQHAGLLTEQGILSPSVGDRLGIIFTSSFAHHESALDDVARHAFSQGREMSQTYTATQTAPKELALKIVVDANAQLAEMVGAKGPNTHVVNACASTTCALHMARLFLLQDADVMLIISCDTPLSEGMANHAIRQSFVTLGAATSPAGTGVMQPFGARRCGFAFGDAAIGILLTRDRAIETMPSSTARARLLASKMANAAHSGTRLDSTCMAKVLSLCIQECCADLNIGIDAFCARALYISHDTCTPTCALAEVEALNAAVGCENAAKIGITNSKMMFGHTMGVCMEDVVSIESIRSGATFEIRTDVAPCFSHLRFYTEGDKFDFCVHMSLGMGSHVAVAIFGKP